jgi:hypothetical protein
MTPAGWVAVGWVAVEESDRHRLYLATIEGPGGKPAWTPSETEARAFSTREDARNALRAASPGRVLRGFRRTVRRLEETP